MCTGLANDCGFLHISLFFSGFFFAGKKHYVSAGVHEADVSRSEMKTKLPSFIDNAAVDVRLKGL